MTAIKICGLRRPEDLTATARAGASHAGFVFYPPSPRAITPTDAAGLITQTPPGLTRVGLFVDPDDALLDTALAGARLDLIQLHGQETPERLAQIRRRTGLPVMKAVGLADRGDLAVIHRYAETADMLLIDAKPAKDANLPGGNGVAFDWRLLEGQDIPVPWLLAGGLCPDNVAAALTLTHAPGVDVSSGVESAPGIKDPDLIAAFCDAAKAGGGYATTTGHDLA